MGPFLFKNEPYVSVERGNTGLGLCLANQTVTEKLKAKAGHTLWSLYYLHFPTDIVCQMFHEQMQTNKQTNKKHKVCKTPHCFRGFSLVCMLRCFEPEVRGARGRREYSRDDSWEKRKGWEQGFSLQDLTPCQYVRTPWKISQKLVIQSLPHIICSDGICIRNFNTWTLGGSTSYLNLGVIILLKDKSLTWISKEQCGLSSITDLAQ